MYQYGEVYQKHVSEKRPTAESHVPFENREDQMKCQMIFMVHAYLVKHAKEG